MQSAAVFSCVAVCVACAGVLLLGLVVLGLPILTLYHWLRVFDILQPDSPVGRAIIWCMNKCNSMINAVFFVCIAVPVTRAYAWYDPVGAARPDVELINHVNNIQHRQLVSDLWIRGRWCTVRQVCMPTAS